jgi:hypothetical protein
MKNPCPFIIPFLLMIAIAQSAGAETPSAEPKNRESVGVRMGYARTTSAIDDAFGAGFAVAIHFTEKIHPPFALNFAVGSLYLGRTWRKDITLEQFQTTDEMRMDIFFLTVEPGVELPLSDRYVLVLAGGLGLYNVSLVREAGLWWGSTTQYHVGINGSMGMYRVLTDNLNLELNLAGNYFWTQDAFDDWIAVYSHGDQDPFFYQITVGLTLDVR